MRTLEASADAALQAEHVSEVVFLEFDFLSGASRVCSREHSVDWNGETWLGAGRVGSIEPLEEGGALQARGLAMTLSALPGGMLATALTPGEYKGREVRVWFGQVEPEIIDFDFTQATLVAQVGAALASIGFTRAGATATRVNEQGLIETVAADTPRFDYDPVTLECKGLLVEGGRENLLLRSAEFDNAAWNNGGITITANDAVSPDGTATADRVTSASDAGSLLAQNVVAVATADHTFSVWAKQGSASDQGVEFVLRDDTAAVNVATGSLNYATGAFIIGAGAGTVKAYPNGWYRISLTGSIGIGNTARAYVGFAGGLNTSGQYMYAWGAQVEQGAFASTYIPTTTAAVTRNSDVPLCSDISEFFNPVEGTLVTEFTVGESTGPVSVTYMFASFDDGGTNERMQHRATGAASSDFLIVDGGAVQAFIGAVTLVARTTYRAAAAYKLNDCAASVGGGAVSSDATATIPTVDRLAIGCGGAGAFQCNAHIRRFTYSPKRLGNSALPRLSGGEDPRAFAVGQRISADPIGPFIFKMDQLSFQLGETATIRLTAESRLADWNRPRVRRSNSADHRALHPDDRFFEYVESQVEAVHRW